jgi:formylglycine-generating enzyme required for sulfatase activity
MFNKLSNFIKNLTRSKPNIIEETVIEARIEESASAYEEEIVTEEEGSFNQEAFAYARNFGGTNNSDWEPVFATLGEINPDTPLPDLEMYLVPVGSFQMGNKAGREDEKPLHTQRITQPYWIARFPVTNAQWRAAVEANIVKQPHGYNPLNWYNTPQMVNAPVVGVNWFDSLAFCNWLNAESRRRLRVSLPTEILWEYAASGIESWTYPWGNDWSGNEAVWSENSNQQPAPVNTRPDSMSWVGAMHMSGNVWEWQLNEYREYPYQARDGREHNLDEADIRRALRGGAFSFKQNMLTCSARNSSHQLLEHNYLGLRVVVSF